LTKPRFLSINNVHIHKIPYKHRVKSKNYLLNYLRNNKFYIIFIILLFLHHSFLRCYCFIRLLSLLQLLHIFIDNLLILALTQFLCLYHHLFLILNILFFPILICPLVIKHNLFINHLYLLYFLQLKNYLNFNLIYCKQFKDSP